MKKYRLRNYNFRLVAAAITLAIYGVFIIGSAKESVQMNQVRGLIIAVAVMAVISLIDYSFILNFSWAFYFINIGLLFMVKFFGKVVNNSKRWVSIAGIQFQPSEAAKILLILFFAQFIMKHKDKLNKFSTIAMALLLILPPWFLVYDEPDLSTSIVILAIFCVMMFIGGLSYKFIGAFFAVALPIFIIGIVLILQPDQEIIEHYQQLRILAWLQPDKYENTTGYQQQNSKTAIGSGQLTGKGYKNNEVGSVKNGNFIAEPQTDFIMAIVGEELGFVGCMVIVILTGIITCLCIHIGMHAKDIAGTLICAGVATHIGFQCFVNIGVTTGLLPNTGLPLPFISYGSTSLVILFAELGVVLNVGLQTASNIGTQKKSLSFE